MNRTLNRVPARLKPLAAAAVALALLSGCALAPTYQRPASPVAQHWDAEGQAGDASAPGSAASVLDWRDFVTDPSLRGLVETALANNRDLRRALLNVEAARAMYRVQRAERLPGIGAQASGSRQHNPADLNPAGNAGVQSEWRAGLGVNAFELDLFGRVRSLSQAALEEYLATEAGARGARISLIAEVIEAYLTRESARQRGLHTERTLASREASLQLIGRRRAEGIGSALDYEQAKGLADQARADLARMEREYRQSTNALTLLAGISDLSPYLAPHDAAAPLLVQQLAAGVPSELLALRPDILAAEHRLRARNADIGAARAAFFPRISLTGMFGSASADLSDLFKGGQRAWSFAPQLTLPLFDGGRNQANLDLAKLRKDMAVAEYEQSIQAAFREVMDGLAATDTLRRQEAAQQAQAESSQAALRLSEARYRGGVDSYLRYLDAQRSDFVNQIALIEVRTQRQVALATLFRALGGGWRGDVDGGQ
ncbi:efflux transporter outer membrane subunit [Achromobacter xylosoxidans]|uniref:efflux transporter outer membrane subunit n=1 Tax=Alcaligenes xylosoxydans xylosoxydans TaxID=85698 RepID=UPI0022B93C0F|nr:efflux transporter outer membrane subunit [Achromobacter xylosoxidans]MCZ8389565.1 efflux transporter outer membrane subunit [Achromobacter xylosoxidans]